MIQCTGEKKIASTRPQNFFLNWFLANMWCFALINSTCQHRFLGPGIPLGPGSAVPSSSSRNGFSGKHAAAAPASPPKLSASLNEKSPIRQC
jgi:hypothetical protein